MLLACGTPGDRELLRSLIELAGDLQVVGETGEVWEARHKVNMLRPDVVVVDASLSGEEAFAFSRELTQDFHLGVVMVAAEANPRLFRQAMQAGVRDLLVKPWTAEDLSGSLRGAVPVKVSTDGSERERGKVITIFGTKGGAGKTTIATNLALALAMLTREPVALVDLDLEFGTLATMLGLKPYSSIVNLCREEGPMTPERVERVMLPFRGQPVRLLAAPPSPDLAAEVEGDGKREPGRNYVAEIIEVLQGGYPYVVIDTATGFRDVNLTALDLASLVLVVTTPDIPALENTAKGLDVLLDRLGYSKEKVRLVLNRANFTGGLTYEDISRGLEVPLSFFVPSDGQRVSRAANLGKPVVLDGEEAPIVDTFKQLAKGVLDIFEGKLALARAHRRRWFGRWFGWLRDAGEARR